MTILLYATCYPSGKCVQPPILPPVHQLLIRSRISHCELFESDDALLTATNEFFERYNRTPGSVRSFIGL